MIYTTDDLCVENLPAFGYWDKVKERNPTLRLVAFTIAKGIDTPTFREWFASHQAWVEIGVHGYDHEKPQEGWREDQDVWIGKALTELRPFLLSQPLYRPPGFRCLPKTEAILKTLGFAGIAHQGFIKYFDTGVKVPVFNTHCTENHFSNPIGQLWQTIRL